MKSQFIQDLVSKNNDLESILLRLKVILYELKDEKIMEWINKELEGYNKGDQVPDYRVLQLTPYCTMTDNINVYQNIDAPTGAIKTQEEADAIFKHTLTIGVSGMIEDENLCINYGVDIKDIFANGIVDRRVFVMEAYGKIEAGGFEKIKGIIKNKILTIALSLEEKYGNLDELDVLEKIDEAEKKEIIQYIHQQINNDVTIGENSKISDSNLGVNKNE